MTNGRVDVEEERRVQEKRVQIKLALGEKKGNGRGGAGYKRSERRGERGKSRGERLGVRSFWWSETSVVLHSGLLRVREAIPGT